MDEEKKHAPLLIQVTNLQSHIKWMKKVSLVSFT